MGCKKRSILSRCAHFLLGGAILFSTVFMSVPQTAQAAFEYSGTELRGGMKSIFHPNAGYYKRTSQGFCIAGNYIIYTRWSSNSSPTTYVVLDAKTRKELGHYDFSTLHSNSLTYNPNTNEVVSVACGKAYVLQLSGSKLTYKKSVSLSKMICRIAYVKAEGAYYLATGTHMYKSKDLSRLSELYSLRAIAVNQGMGYDGKYLYICYSGSSKNYMQKMTTGGKMIETLTLSNYAELEEVDFYNGNMYVNIINSSSLCGLYEIVGKGGSTTASSSKPASPKPQPSNDKKNDDKKSDDKKSDDKSSDSTVEEPKPEPHKHSYGEWKVTKEATCGEDGEKQATCECGDISTKAIPATGDHKYGKWKTVIEETCGDKGQKQRTCEVCGYVEVAEIPATGDHTLGDWEVTKEATCEKKGEQIIVCQVCGQTIKKEKIPAKGHAYTGWAQTEAPTVFSEGKEERYCVNCDSVKKQSIPALEPTISISATEVALRTGETADAIGVNLLDGDSVACWSSADENIATVNEDGEITAVSKGSTTVSVTAESGVSAQVQVDVQFLPVKTKEVEVQASKGLIGNQLDMIEGESIAVDVSVQPVSARSNAHYYSLSSVVASVDENGLVTANQEGTTKIVIRVGFKFQTLEVNVHKNVNTTE